MSKELTSFDYTQENRRLALLLAVNCVRNTVIENYHAEGKLDDLEMMAFNKEVANKLFSALEYMFNPKYADQADAFMGLMSWMYPTNWDQPKMDKEFVKGMSYFLKGHL